MPLDKKAFLDAVLIIAGAAEDIADNWDKEQNSAPW